MDTTKISNIEFEDVNKADYPDFCDAFISYAEIDGKPMTEDELIEINEDTDFVYNQLMASLY